jgi:hypothetical protein
LTLATAGRHGGAGVQQAAGGHVVPVPLLRLQLLQQGARFTRSVTGVGHQATGWFKRCSFEASFTVVTLTAVTFDLT